MRKLSLTRAGLSLLFLLESSIVVVIANAAIATVGDAAVTPKKEEDDDDSTKITDNNHPHLQTFDDDGYITDSDGDGTRTVCPQDYVAHLPSLTAAAGNNSAAEIENETIPSSQRWRSKIGRAHV